MANSEHIVVTGRVVYADVIRPSRFKTWDGKDKWSCRVLIAKSDKTQLNMLAKALLGDERAQTIFGKELKFRKGTFEIDGIRSSDHQPLKNGDTVNQPDHKGHVYIQATATKPPQVVDARTQPVMDEGVVYSGCYCNVAVAVKSYAKSQSVPASGLGWHLNAVQFVKDGPSISSGPSVGDIFKPIASDEGGMDEVDPFENEEKELEDDLIG